MIEASFSFETLPYKRPVPVRGFTACENIFLKVSVLEKDYFISTLPGFHESSLNEIKVKIQTFFTNYELHFNHIDFKKKFFNLTSANDSFLNSINKEVLFNLEAILLDIIHATNEQLFSHETVLINDLYRPGGDYQASSCLKMKIAPDKDRALECAGLISSLNEQNPLTTFRLDGNRRFELDELIMFVEILEKELTSKAFSQIDYLEEPLKNFYETFLFEKRSKIKIAIDESFENYIVDKKISYPVVIKPSLFGISTIYSWLSSHPNNRAVISSSFEHPTIMRGLYFLAQTRPHEFHGLENFHERPM